MTKTTHDTLAELRLGTPAPFIAAAFSLPALLALQFLLAGQALFAGLPWDLHGAFGGVIAIPVFTLLWCSLIVRRLRGFGWWAGALHPFNAALLLTASLIVLFKVERRRSARAIRD